MKHQNSELSTFIKRNSHLFWYTPENLKEDISEELLLEQVLNYADLPTIKEYFEIVGLNNASRIFKNLTGRKKNNIYPSSNDYFKKYIVRKSRNKQTSLTLSDCRE